MELTFGLPGAIPVWIQWKGRLSASGLRGHPYSSTFKEETGNPSGNYSWNKGACHRHSGSQNVFRRGGVPSRMTLTTARWLLLATLLSTTLPEKKRTPDQICLVLELFSWLQLQDWVEFDFAIPSPECLLFWCNPGFYSPVSGSARDRFYNSDVFQTSGVQFQRGPETDRSEDSQTQAQCTTAVT